jgi:hypothetical protein
MTTIEELEARVQKLESQLEWLVGVVEKQHGIDEELFKLIKMRTDP